MRHVARWALALSLVFAGVSHLFWGRREFQAQVPDLTTKVLDKDAVVIASGVVDPTKVTRSALQNAASISGLLLTTEALITEIPEKKAAPAGDPHHGHGGGEF